MRIPFANRTADVDLPVIEGQPKVNVKAIVDSFRDQVPSNFEALFEAFVLLSPRKVRVTCRSTKTLEEVCHLGLTFRNSPVKFNPCRSAKWVQVTKLSYGVPNEALITALKPYGRIIDVKMDAYKGVHIGIRQVLIDISAPIPSLLRVADHWCHTYYPGQLPTCFACHKTGHTRANCPTASTQPARVQKVVAVESTDGGIKDNTAIIPDASSRSHGSQSFADVVREKSPVPPAEILIPEPKRLVPADKEVGNTETSSEQVHLPVEGAGTATSGEGVPEKADNPAPETEVQPQEGGSHTGDAANSATVLGSDATQLAGAKEREAPHESEERENKESEEGEDEKVAESEEASSSEGDEDDDEIDDSSSSPTNKRYRSDSDSASNSSDSSIPPPKEKLARYKPSPDLFDLQTALNTPLPADIDSTTDMNLDTPANPDKVDEPSSTPLATDSMDYPLTQLTPRNRKITTQCSSEIESMFRSKRTKPRPVFGAGRLSKK
jgi:hypothetical protein